MLAAFDPFFSTLAGALLGGAIVLTGQILAAKNQANGEEASRRHVTDTEARRDRDEDLRRLQDHSVEYVNLAMTKAAWQLTGVQIEGTNPMAMTLRQGTITFQMKAIAARIGDPDLTEVTMKFLAAYGSDLSHLPDEPSEAGAAKAADLFHGRVGEMYRSRVEVDQITRATPLGGKPRQPKDGGG